MAENSEVGITASLCDSSMVWHIELRFRAMHFQVLVSSFVPSGVATAPLHILLYKHYIVVPHNQADFEIDNYQFLPFYRWEKWLWKVK